MAGLDLKSLLRNTAGTLSRQLVGGLLQLATVVLIARMIGPDGNGAYAIGMLLPTALSTFLIIGIPTANVYLVGSRRHSLYDAWIGNLQAWASLTLIGMAIGYVLIKGYGEVVFPSVDPWILWLALLVYPPMLFLNLHLSLLQAEQRFREYNLAFVTLPVSQVLLSLCYLVLLQGKDLKVLVLIQLCASLLAAWISLHFILPRVRSKHSLNRSFLDPAVRYGSKAYLGNILSYANHKTDLFLINIYLGTASAGIYVVASQLTEKLWLASQGLSTVLLPRLASLEGQEDKRQALTPLLTRWVLAITLVCGLTLAIASPLLVRLLFGKEFSQSATIIQILVPGIALGAASRILASDFSARGRPELSMYTSWIALLINVVGNISLLPVLGLKGSAISTSFAYTLNMVMRCFMFRKITGTKIRDCLIIKGSDLMMLREKLIAWRAS